MTAVDERWQERTCRALYNLMLALWVGGIFIYTFLVTPVVFKSFGRDTASAIVDQLFPFYFPYILAIVGLTLGFFILSDWKRNARPRFALASLVIAALIALSVNFGLYPEIRRTKQEISSFETTAVDLPARKQFRTLHGISMILNLVLLVDGITLIVIGSYSRKRIEG